MITRPKLDFDPNFGRASGASNLGGEAKMQHQTLGDNGDDEDDFNFDGAAVLDKSAEKE